MLGGALGLQGKSKSSFAKTTGCRHRSRRRNSPSPESAGQVFNLSRMLPTDVRGRKQTFFDILKNSLWPSTQWLIMIACSSPGPCRNRKDHFGSGGDTEGCSIRAECLVALLQPAARKVVIAASGCEMRVVWSRGHVAQYLLSIAGCGCPPDPAIHSGKASYRFLHFQI